MTLSFSMNLNAAQYGGLLHHGTGEPPRKPEHPRWGMLASTAAIYVAWTVAWSFIVGRPQWVEAALFTVTWLAIFAFQLRLARRERSPKHP